MKELLIDLHHDTDIALYEQIYAYICKEIIDGKISPGEKLPSTRFMAKNLQISRSTVELAYAQLVAEGYIETKPCAGYFVCDVSGLYLWNRQQETAHIRLSKDGANGAAYRIAFSPFEIDEQHFPFRVWQKLSRSVSWEDDSSLFHAGDSQGDVSLRTEIAGYLHRARGVNCEPQQIVVGAGNEYLLLLLSQMIGKNRMVAMERYTYVQAARTFQNMEYMVIPVDMDDAGLVMKKVRTLGADILYAMPSHQFPLGTVMPMKRRLELLSWAMESPERYIIEDDHDSEFRYRGRPIPSLQGMDHAGHVIYLGTFSKSIAQSVRVSYMVLPKQLLEIYHKNCSFYSTTVPRAQQELLCRFMAEGSFERHLNRMKKLYKSKQDTMYQLLKQESWVKRIYGENAGLHMNVELAENQTEQAVIRSAAEHGIKLFGLSDYQLAGTNTNINTSIRQPTLLMGYGNLTEEQMREGIAVLRNILT